jgi:co-chaperonin GroES (HSP10)
MKGIPEGVEIPSIRPINDQILVYLEPDADGFSAAPSLVKPESAKADHVFRIGRVCAKGPGNWHPKKPRRIPVDVEIGARVLFVKFVATHTKTAESIQHTLGKDFALLRQKDLLLELDEDVRMEDISQ